MFSRNEPVSLTNEVIACSDTAKGLSAATIEIKATKSARFSTGAGTPIVGDQLTGGGAVILIAALVVESGTWGGGDAAGTVFFEIVSGTPAAGAFTAEGGKAITITAPKILNRLVGCKARKCVITCKNSTVYFCTSGDTPTQSTTGVGFPLTPGGSYEINGHKQIRDFLAIDSVSGGGAIINAECFF